MIYKIIFISLLLFISCGNKIVPNREITNVQIPEIKSDSTFDYTPVITSLKKQLPESYYVTTFSSFVIASNLSSIQTNSIVSNTIEKTEECLYNDYLEIKPNEITTIFLFKDDKSYREIAKKLYGDTDLSRFGYYKPGEKAMLMNISTGTGTLVHELTHCFVNYDFPDIPSWFNEGLGSLYERCSLNDNQILGYVNWRLPELQEAISNKTYTSLETLMGTSDKTFYGDNSSLNYAQARYFCLYLQQKGLLKKYYKTFRDRFEEDKTGIIFLKEILKTDVSSFDKTYVEWVKTLKLEN